MQTTSDSGKVIGTVAIDDGTGGAPTTSDANKLIGILRIDDGSGGPTSDADKLIGRVRLPTGGEFRTSDADKIIGMVRIADGTEPRTSDAGKVIGTVSLFAGRITNAEKLALPSNTPVGTTVEISDAFAFTGTDSVYTKRGTVTTGDGERDYYNLIGKDDDPSAFSAYYHSTTRWSIYGTDGGNRLYKQADPENHYQYPWQVPLFVVDQGAPPVPTLTYPAQQTLAVADPSSESSWDITT